MIVTTAPGDVTRRRASVRLLRFGRPVLAPLVLSLLCRATAQVLGVALLATGAWGVARVADDPTTRIAPLLWAMVGLSVAKGAVRYLEQFTGHWVAFKALAMLRIEVYRTLVPQSPAGILSRHTGDLLSRATKDVDRVEVFFAHTLVPAATAVLVPLGLLTVLAVGFDPVLALVLLPFLVGVGLLVPVWGRENDTRAATTVRSARGVLGQLTTESVQGVREILAFGAGARRRSLVAQVGEQVTDGLTQLGRWTARRRGTNAALVVTGLITVVLVGSARVGSGALEWPVYVVACAIALGSFEPVLAVEDVASDLEQAFASARRIWAVTDAEPATRSPAHPAAVPSGPLDVTFEGVTFTYPDGQSPAVDGISFTIAAGTTTAVLGHSGSGKSTLAHLLTRAWDPTCGRVLLGGLDVCALSLEDLRRHVSVVEQSTYLFNDTVAANVRLARPDATDAEIEDACRRARLHDTLLALPDGYDTMVGEMGERLSGGQRQRVAIARALLADSPVLVLDEATSQLDVTTETEIQDALAEAGRGRTVLLIAHRPGAARTADQVVRLEAGRRVGAQP